jgi:hypothetical protein
MTEDAIKKIYARIFGGTDMKFGYRAFWIYVIFCISTSIMMMMMMIIKGDQRLKIDATMYIITCVIIVERIWLAIPLIILLLI